MPRNGSGTYSLPEPAFVPNTPISSASVNSDFSDIGSALTASVAADGQTTITGPIKFASGSVSLPSITFASDTDTGLYRIAANNLGVAVGGTKIVDVSSTGISVTGTFTPTGQFLAPDGTVLLPEYSFTNDPDSGLYRIGANNLGVAVNAAKVLDISTSGLNVVGTVFQNGNALAQAAASTLMINGTLVESHTGNAATFAIKTLAGTDPSSTDQVVLLFRDVTAANGTYAVVQVTSALSLTISSGSTLGTTNGIPFKLWFCIFNDGGTPHIAVINTVSGLNTYPLAQFPIASSTAEGGVGGADSAQVFYTGTAVSSKAYIPIAYASYESGLATAGAWASSPTRIMLFGPNVPLPGQTVQTQQNVSSGAASTATLIPYDNTIPQSSEGNEFLSQAITPTSSTNILEVDIVAMLGNDSSADLTMALFRDAGPDAIAAIAASSPTASASVAKLRWPVLASSTSGTTFKMRAGSNTNTTRFNSSVAGAKYGGTAASIMSVREIMT